MTEEISQKVINIFSRHKSGKLTKCDEKIVECEDGIYCICVRTDKKGSAFVEDDLLNRAFAFQYIVKVMVNDSASPLVYNYKVPGEKLAEFIDSFSKGEKDGQIIEIDKYLPTDMA